eukprot:gnl/MRDRNA2_/MRDRNA2_89928_c0_seq1.p1 gnl/MRDRNA2_/MRDRNA2_89928_c0~~gnl/MRDRNA2_/MRDRNA2_89928_c0_seq1.p1  ORF type:complete len:1087 (+),score=234.05 gnl/MRDRNA2_/MRDRNA2_89928_c0_seq1:90-3350(+)
MASLYRHARVNSNSSAGSGSSSEGEAAITTARHRSASKSKETEAATPRTPGSPRTPHTPPSTRHRYKSANRRGGWRGSLHRVTRQFTSKLNSKSNKAQEDQSPSKMQLTNLLENKDRFGLSKKGPVKDHMTGLNKDQFRISISNDTMFQIAQADVSKALKQAGYTVTGLMPNLVNAAVDAAWGQVGKVSSACERVKAELDAVKARDVEMKLVHLREISQLRDQIRHVNSDSLKAMNSAELENVQLYDALNYLDEDMKTLVMEIVEEKLKELLSEDPDATVVSGTELNHFALGALLHGRSEQVMSKYKEDNTNLREEVKALKMELSAQKETSSSLLATLKEESRATQESLENEIAHLKQELKSERSRVEGLSKELEKVKQQHQEALVRQNHYVAACQASFSKEQMENFQIKTSHDKLKLKLNQLFSDHVDLKYELQESKKSEEEKTDLVIQVKQLERQAEKEAARVKYLQDLFQTAISEKAQVEEQFRNLVEDAVAQVDHDNNPEKLQANLEELQNALQLAESTSRRVGQEKRQLEAELRDEKMSLLLTRAINESLRPAALSLPQKGSDDGILLSESIDLQQHEYKAGDERDDSARNSDTITVDSVNSNASLSSTMDPDGVPGNQSDASVKSTVDATLTSTTATCDADLGLTAEDNIIKMDSHVRMSPLERMENFAITQEDLMRICMELDGSDQRTNELEAAVADAMAIIRQYQSREMQSEGMSEDTEDSEEEHAKMVQEQLEQLQKALMHEVSQRRSLQEQYQVQEAKLTKLLQEVPSQSPVESRVHSPSSSPKPPAGEPSLTALPSSLTAARNVQALNEKIQRKDDMIKTKQAQIKMLLAENQRLRGGASRARQEIARLRARLRMCRCGCKDHSPAAMGMHLGKSDSDEASDPSLKYQIQDEVCEASGDERLYVDSSTRQVKSFSANVVYAQMEDRQEPAALLIPTRPPSSVSSRRKQPVTISPVGKPKKEEFHAELVGVQVRKRSTDVIRKHSTEAAPDKHLLPEINCGIVKESMNARRRPQKLTNNLSVPQATVRRNSAPEPPVTLSVSSVSLSEGNPRMIDLAKSRPASGHPVMNPRAVRNQ